MKMIKCLRYLIIVAMIVFSVESKAQDILKMNDLTQVHVDQLSDAQIQQLQQQLQSSGYTLDQALQIAVAKGLPSAEANKLKARLSQGAIGTNGTQKQGKTDSLSNRHRRNNNYDSLYRDTSVRTFIDPKIFGAELFNNTSLTFNPNSNSIATPFNYILGPGDDMDITVYGVQETSISTEVTKEGNVKIPNVGQVRITGLSIEEATAKIKQIMESTAYGSLRSGSSKLAVNIGGVRGLHVTVIGANIPGNYTLSSLSSVYNALYLAGGPNKNGSFRKIELVRNNKVERTIDLYRFLVNGDQSDNVRLKDNDVIRIPAYTTRTELKGEVKRPGYFEVLPGESFARLLEFASGFTDTAYKASVTVSRYTDKERQIKDVLAADYASFMPAAGDVYEIGKILKRFSNRVTIQGAVFRPASYELKPDMHVADLIRRADGLKEEAFSGRGQVVRLKEDFSKEVITFNIKAALNGSAADNVELKREDEVIISSIFDLRDEYKVTILGEVRVPGVYGYGDSLTLKDLIVLAGGFTDAAYPQRIEVARLLRRDTLTASDVRASDIIELNNGGDLSDQSKNVQLSPFDIVTIRRKPGPREQESIIMSGQIQYPGPYVIADRSERVSSVIKRAGGFTPEAYVEGAYLKRYPTEKERELKRMKIAKLQQALLDTSKRALIEDEFDQLPLDLPAIMAKPNSTEDIVLKPRDEIIVPKFDAEVKVSGGVLLPTQIPYRNNYTVKDYISSAGGLAPDVIRRKIYVLYANGSAKATKHFLFIKTYPKVKPGSEVVVPRKPPRKNNSGELIGIASAVASIALVIVTLINNVH
ncbi:SLBB domain-containing protein [Deminuibacter soli]|nr:SLBB domain-containing protein [Deminuibacter soli]